MVFYNILPNGKHSTDSLELRCMISVVHCKCYVLDSLKCFPHPLSGVNKTHSAFKDVCFTYALSFLQEEIKFDEKMQGGDPEEDNIESVDDVTGSDPDLIQQEVITYYFSFHLFLKLQIVIEKKILSEVPNSMGRFTIWSFIIIWL